MLPLGRLSKNGTCHGPQNRMTQFTKDEQITMMSLWGIFKSPLMFGGNLPENDEWTLSLLTNEKYLKMHRECNGAHQYYRNEKKNKGKIIWIANGKKCKYAALFNTDDKVRKIKLSLADILMPDEEYEIYDIWQKQSLGKFKNSFSPTVSSNNTALIKITTN